MIMYIYHALINALSTHMIHTDLNMIFYTHIEHSPTKTIYIKYYLKHVHTHTHSLTHLHAHMHARARARNDCSRNRVLILVRMILVRICSNCGFLHPHCENWKSLLQWLHSLSAQPQKEVGFICFQLGGCVQSEAATQNDSIRANSNGPGMGGGGGGLSVCLGFVQMIRSKALNLL